MNTFRLKHRITDEEFVKVCSESLSMAIAAKELKIHFNSLKKRAIELGCYKPNPSGKGLEKQRVKGTIPLNEILEGKHPSYQTFKLKNRLLKEGIKKNQCEICGGGPTWNDKPLNCELDHINGDDSDHRKENLRMICPNCHSQTDTFRSKNRK